MKYLISIYNRLAIALTAMGPVVVPTLARLVFAGVLAGYFWSAAVLKLGPGVFGFLRPSDGAYVQIFPKMAEAVGYDFSKFGLWEWAVATAGMWAEFLLPLLIILGLFTRIAAFGMIFFVIVQSLTDIYGHGVGPEAIGAWIDQVPDAAILDQRSLWMLLLIVLISFGAGPLSLDAALRRSLRKRSQAS